MSDLAPIRTRFAPSPSGHLHVGGARTALFNWAYARGRGGAFILRIEDTDQKRSSDAASVGFLQDLKWLSIEWDEGPEFDGCGGGAQGPYFQSERLDVYRRHAERLIDAGHAYRAFETTEELDAAREKARAEKQTYRYDRAALALDDATIDKYLTEGRPHVVRFRLPDDLNEVTVHDEVLGDIRKGIEELDDFVIIKADGYPTYHFAVVVDDELMQITHVIRGQEHLNNTLKHVLLQEALDFHRPIYAHVSTITNSDKSKMSKRDKDKALRAAVRERGVGAPPQMPGSDEPAVSDELWSQWQSNEDCQLELEAAERLAEAIGVALPEINVDDFRRAGYLAEVLVNYLALLGWSPGENIEKFDRQFLIERFDLDRIIKSSAAFDRDKLLAFNLDAIQALDREEFHRRFREHCTRYHPAFIDKLSDDTFRVLAHANQPRSKTLEDPIQSCRFFILDDDSITYERSKPVRKALVNGDPNGFSHLEAILPRIREASDWTVAAIEALVKSYVDEHAEGNLGKIAQPLRIAVSGSMISPAIFETLFILGRDATVRRIERCLAERDSFLESGDAMHTSAAGGANHG